MIVIENTHETAQRADVLLANAHPEYSRASLARLFDMGLIFQGQKQLKPGDKIQPGLSLQAEVAPLQKPAEAPDLPVLYEDDDVVVVDKPAGIISHARGRYWDEPSVASFVRARVATQRPEVAKELVQMGGERAGIVHRLDRATSGVMICAKNAQALSMLQRQFSQRKTKKTYIAVVFGTPEPHQAVIDVPLARNPSDPKTFQPDPHGKVALTQYNVEQSNDSYALLRLAPQTGRTHQLRVHLLYIKHPIVGDPIYGQVPGGRLYLHAHSLEITLPNGQRTVFTSPVPPEFAKLVA